jgi:uncharacterized membrane protein YesL
MAGIFGLFDYNKEGPGVQKDEPDKGPVLGTLTILSRRLWDLMKLNLMMILFSIPALLIAGFVSVYLISAIFPELSIASFTQTLVNMGITTETNQQIESMAVFQLTLLYVTVAAGLVCTSLFVVGPFQAGFTYILRNYVRDEHVFVWSDFFEHAKANLRQSFIACVIGAVVTVVLTMNYAFYNNSQIDFLPPLARMAIRMLILMLAVIWILMQQYIYPMMVTFKMTLPQIYRNSLLFVILRLPYNLLILGLAVLMTLIIPFALLYFGSNWAVLIAVAWYLAFAFSIFQFLSVAIVWRGFKKYLIDGVKQD